MKITFKSILIGLGAIFAFVGFGFLFMDPLEAILINPITNEIKVIDTIPWQQVYLGIIEGSEETLPHTLTSFVGFIMMAVAGLAGLAVAGLGRRSKVYLPNLILGVIVAAIAAAGGVLAFFTEKTYLDALGIVKDSALDLVQATYGPMIAGGAGCLGAVCILFGSLMPSPKGKK